MLLELSIWVDCELISADGGTRTPAVAGAYVAAFDALRSPDRSVLRQIQERALDSP